MIGAILAGAGSLLNAGMGVADLIKSGKKQREAQSFFEKNKYEIPESAQAALDIAQRQAGTYGLAGQDLMESKVKQSTVQGVGMAQEAGQSSSDVLSMLASLYGGEQAQMQNIGQAAAQDWQNKHGQLQSALGTMAGLEQQKWQYNVLYPYTQMLGQAEAYGTRGRQQLQSGLGGLASVGMGLEQMSTAQNQFNDWKKTMLGSVGTKSMQPLQAPTFGINAPRTTLAPYSDNQVYSEDYYLNRQ